MFASSIYKSAFIAKGQDGFDQVAFAVGHDVLALIEVRDILTSLVLMALNQSILQLK
tara:strand:+ start:2614 stop:2784 length:171 start_codon:yes stop_codon:yes gene_type:complete